MEHFDTALEKSRRCAWFRFYAARDDARRIAMWAVELAEYLDELDADLPPQAVELIAIVRSSVPEADRWMIARYVRRMLRGMVAS